MYNIRLVDFREIPFFVAMCSLTGSTVTASAMLAEVHVCPQTSTRSARMQRRQYLSMVVFPGIFSLLRGVCSKFVKPYETVGAYH